MKKIIFAFLCLLITQKILFGQQVKIDSLKKALKNVKEDTNKVRILCLLADILSQNDVDQAMHYGNQGILLSNDISYPKGIGTCLNALGRVYFTLGKNDSALLYFEERLKIATKIKDSIGMAASFDNIGIIKLFAGNKDSALLLRKKGIEIYLALNRKVNVGNGYIWIGNIYMSDGNDSAALNNFLSALNIYEKEHDTINTGYALINICNIYRTIRQYDKAEEFGLAAKEKFTRAQIKDRKGLGSSLYRLGLIKSDLGEVDSAIVFFLEAKKTFEQKDKYNIAITNDQLGSNYRKKGNFKLGLSYSLKALSAAKELQSPELIAIVSGNIGLNYKEQKNLTIALDYTQQAYQILKKLRGKNNLKILTIELIDIFSRLNQPDSVVAYVKSYEELSDMLYNEQRNKAITEMEAKYENQKGREEVQKQKEIVARQKREKIKLFAVMGLLVAMLTIIVWLWLRTRRQNSLIERERNAVNNLTEILKHETARQFNSLGRSIKDILNTDSPKLQVSKALVELNTYQMLYQLLFLSSGSATISLKAAFEKLFIYNCDHFGMETKPKFEVIGDGEIVFKSSNYLLHYMNELIANSLLHAFRNTSDPKIIITIKFDKSIYEITYSDNGIGIPPEKQQYIKTKGLYLIEAYATGNLHGTLEKDFSNGSTFKLTFKIKHGTD